MNGPTHLIGGVTSGLIASSVIGAHDAQTVVGVCVAAVAAMVPDRFNVFIPILRVPMFEGHRSVFNHSLLTAIVAYLIIREPYSAFAFAGIVSHLLLDLLGDMGVPLFWPIIPHRVALGWFRNGSAGEVVTRGLLCGMCVFVMLNWIR